MLQLLVLIQFLLNPPAFDAAEAGFKFNILIKNKHAKNKYN